MPVTRVTRKSYWDVIKDQLKRFVFGVLLVVLAFPVLYYDDQKLTDNEFNITVSGCTKLKRDVEMYQWEEEEHKKTRKCPSSGPTPVPAGASSSRKVSTPRTARTGIDWTLGTCE